MRMDRRYMADDETIGLRPFELDDVPAVTAACQDPAIARWTTIPSPYLEVRARSWIARHDQLRADGVAFPFAIVHRESGRLLGSIDVQEPGGNPASGVVGYWVAAEDRNRGGATRALRLTTAWAFRELELASLRLCTMIGNVASERVADKAGYNLVGEVTDHRPLNALDRDFHVREWRTPRNAIP